MLPIQPDPLPLLLAHETSAHPLGRRRAVGDALVIAGVVAVFFWLACSWELSERFFQWASIHENLQVDELPLTLVVLSASLVAFGRRRVQELAVEVAARKRAEDVAVRVSEQNRMLAQQLISLQEQERRHLARELHDEIGQYCVAIKVDASTIARDTNGHLPRAHGCAVAMGQTADHLHNTVRGLLERLRPTALDELGLPAALQVLTDAWATRHGVTCELTVSGSLGSLGEAANITLYRIVQECLTNVARHARARYVAVSLSVQGDDRGSPCLVLCVRDDGGGMSATPPRGGLGLVGMRERAQALGGVLEIRQTKRGGTCLEVSLPLRSLSEVAA